VDFGAPVEAIIPDAQGKILAALARTTGELSTRALADLSGVSIAHTARTVQRLVRLGIVERRSAPPTALLKLARHHLAAHAILSLADLRHTFEEELRESAMHLDPLPVAVVLFGSFARGEDNATSDVDVLVVRPRAIDADEPRWVESMAQWESHVRDVSGNALSRIEVTEGEVPKLFRSRRPLWQAIRREGIVLQGLSLAELIALEHG
jgi:predicted nucleotidyltransferase